MIIRKERVHHSGTSNLPQQHERRLPRLNIPLNNSRESSLTNLSSTKSARAGYGHTTSHSVFNKLNSPMKETERFYKSHGKPVHIKTMLSDPKTSEFDLWEERKSVFIDKLQIATEKGKTSRATSLDREVEKHGRQSLLKAKDNEHGQAVQETQLVGFSKHLETLKNNVNLEKVQEAKRLLRRRYANRPNIQKVYSSWNEEGKGEISVENVFHMSKKLGLNLNFDESRVLLACADRNSTGTLGLDEFMDLVYNKDDTLNVNLDHLASKLGKDYLIRKEELERGDDNLLQRLQEDAKKAREVRHMNQITLMLKNRLNDLKVALHDKDPDKTGRMNFNTFQDAMKKLRLGEIALSRQDVQELFNKYQGNSDQIDYNVFVKNLQNFKLEYDHEYRNYVPTSQFKRGNSLAESQLVDLDYNKVNVVDCRQLPYNAMVNYFGRSKKVGREIQKFFPQKEDLNDFVLNTLKIPKEEADKHVVTKKEFKEVVERLFTNLDINHMNNRDLEGFFSSVLFNKHGLTSIKEISHTIYDETEDQFQEKILRRKKGPAPHTTHSSPVKGDRGDMFETPKKLRTIEEDEGASKQGITDDLEYAKKYSESEKKSSKKVLVKKYSVPSMKPISISSEEKGAQLDDDLKAILKDVDHAVFDSQKPAYKVFKEFDLDNDGYISHKDITEKLQGKHHFKQEDVARVLDYIDPEQKGYVEFTDFHKKIYPNMASLDENGIARDRLGLRFFKPDFEHEYKTMTATKEIIDQVKATLRPKVRKMPVTERLTRDGANPAWKNTFLNMQPDSNSPMFITEEKRFDRGLFASTRFQVEEKQKMHETKMKKWENMRETQEAIRGRIEHNSMLAELREQSHLMSKSMSQKAYEKASKLKNIFA